MRISTRVLIFLALLATAFVPAAMGSDLEVSVDAKYANRYVWRGQLGTDDPVLQRGVDVQYDNINFNVFFNMDASGGDFGKIDEVNYALSYSDYLPGRNLSGGPSLGYMIGVVHYDYPTTDIQETTEICGGIGVDMFLNPTVTAYHDVGEADGLYVRAGIGECVNVLGFNTSLIATLGWGDNKYNQYYWETAQSGSHSGSGSFQDLVLRASIPLRVAGNIEVVPSIAYIQLLDDELQSFNTYSDSSCNLVASVSATVKF